MNLLDKVTSRKLWVAVAGMFTAAMADKPILSAILGGVYVIVEGVIDAVRTKGAAK
jgi:hypothetical protein